TVDKVDVVDIPVGFGITDYHFILLFQHRIAFISRVSLTLVYELALSEERYGTMKGMAVDTERALRSESRHDQPGIWLYSDKNLFALHIENEDKVRAWDVCLSALRLHA
ncbi:hypothetical protein EON66_07660, partial [archaeon]